MKLACHWQNARACLSSKNELVGDLVGSTRFRRKNDLFDVNLLRRVNSAVQLTWVGTSLIEQIFGRKR